MMRNRRSSYRCGARQLATARRGMLVLLALAIGLCSCSSNDIHLAQLAWRNRNKSTAPRPSPYAPVPIGPPSSPPPPENTSQYGDSVDRVVASVDGNPITNFDVQNPPAGMNSATGNNPAGLDPDSTLKELIAQQLLNQEASKYADRVDE